MSFANSVDVVTVPDFSDPVDWEPILRGMDIVIHRRATPMPTNPTACTANRVNVTTTHELAHAAARAGVKRFLFISSVRAQTGVATAHVVKEQDEPAPSDIYGRSKLAAELAVRAAGVPFTILRPVVIYGPHPKGNFKLIVRLALSPLPLPLAGYEQLADRSLA